MRYLDLLRWVIYYHIWYVWASIKWLWTRKSPGDYWAGLCLLTIAVLGYHMVNSFIKELLYAKNS